jgi:hypothetical protein
LPFPSYQWYEVSLGLIAGATNQYYVPTALGSYYCVVDDTIGCVATSNTITLTGIEHYFKCSGDLTIYPNPNDGNFELVINSVNNNQGKQIRIFDAVGQVVFKSETKSPFSLTVSSSSLVLRLPFLTSGIYFIELRSDDFSLRKKFIVSK